MNVPRMQVRVIRRSQSVVVIRASWWAADWPQLRPSPTSTPLIWPELQRWVWSLCMVTLAALLYAFQTAELIRCELPCDVEVTVDSRLRERVRFMIVLTCDIGLCVPDPGVWLSGGSACV